MFDPARIADVATYESPHQYATGVSTVVVNGEGIDRAFERIGERRAPAHPPLRRLDEREDQVIDSDRHQRPGGADLRGSVGALNKL